MIYTQNPMWKEIMEYPNYMISIYGQILSKNYNNIKNRINIIKQTENYGYRRIKLCNQGKRKIIYVHCLVYKHFGKNWDPDLTVDHKNRNRSDNFIGNLRPATRQQQSQNREYKKNKTGFVGVYENNKKWRTWITINGKIVYLGTFDTPEEASAVYEAKARELHGEFYRK